MCYMSFTRRAFGRHPGSDPRHAADHRRAVAPRWNGEIVGWQRWLGLVLGLAGAVIVITARSEIAVPSALGFVFASLALFGITGGSLWEKRFGVSHHPVTSNLVGFTAGFVGGRSLHDRLRDDGDRLVVATCRLLGLSDRRQLSDRHRTVARDDPSRRGLQSLRAVLSWCRPWPRRSPGSCWTRSCRRWHGSAWWLPAWGFSWQPLGEAHPSDPRFPLRRPPTRIGAEP